MATNRSTRDSNLELMRIILMLLIIAHHMVVNSGVMSLIDATAPTANGVFLTLWGMWGKAAINAFVLITGWFMCTSRLTWQKYVRLLAQVYFWKFVVWIFLLVVNRAMPNLTDFVLIVVSPFRYIDDGFLASFLAMNLTIPFLSKLAQALDRGAYLRLLALLLGIYTFTTTFLAAPAAFSEYVWYCTLFFVAGYLRMFRPAWSENRGLVSRLCVASLVLSIASVVAIVAADTALGTRLADPYYFVVDSGKLFAFASGLFVFLWFKGLEMPKSQLVNTVSATTFGVFLIHAHSEAMRTWLWGRGGVFDAATLYETCGLGALVLWCVVAMVSVFAVCSALDWLRIRFVEPAFARWLDAHGEGIEARVRRLTDAVAEKVG